MIRITVHPDVPAGPPLVKKFSVMNAGILPLARYQRDLGMAAALGLPSLRIDLSIGKKVGWKRQFVEGTAERPEYDWAELDVLTDRLTAMGIRPCYAFCYMPKPLQQHGNWRSPPSDLASWREVNRAFAEHHRGRGTLLEVYNEPDFREFFVGTRDEYFDLYREGARGMRDGDPDASIGGPALAFSTEWIAPFLDAIPGEDVPLDFFSFHTINVPLQAPSTRDVAFARLQEVREALAARRRFDTTEIHLNEYHPTKSTAGGLETPSDSLELAVTLLQDFEAFLEEGDLSGVHWAQLMDSGFGGETFGLIDEFGNARPAFYAFGIYNDMPIGRCKVELDGPLGALAARDGDRFGIVVWNASAEPQEVDLSLPVECAEFFRVDHSVPIQPDSAPPGLPPGKSVWNGRLGPWEIVYLRTGPAVEVDLPTLLRTHHRWPGRCRDQAHYDVRSGRFDFSGRAEVGASFRDLPPTLNVRIDAGCRGIRVDFEVGEGYVKSVAFVDGETPRAHDALAWGTKRRPTTVRSIHDSLDLRAVAPEGWAGSAILTPIGSAGSGPASARLLGLR